MNYRESRCCSDRSKDRLCLSENAAEDRVDDEQYSRVEATRLVLSIQYVAVTAANHRADSSI